MPTAVPSRSSSLVLKAEVLMNVLCARWSTRTITTLLLTSLVLALLTAFALLVRISSGVAVLDWKVSRQPVRRRFSIGLFTFFFVRNAFRANFAAFRRSASTPPRQPGVTASRC